MKQFRNKQIVNSDLPCHDGPVEVIENLFCGSKSESLIMAQEICVDTLIPLHIADADIWELGFRGEILYYPINDYKILPTDVLDALISKILDRLSKKKRVGLFCQGGHGRTGYVASVVLGKLGHSDPIQFLRSTYCRQAVESDAQIRHIAEVLDKPELLKKYSIENDCAGDLVCAYCSDPYVLDHDFSWLPSLDPVCRNCTLFDSGICRKYNVFVDEYDFVCACFIAER